MTRLLIRLISGIGGLVAGVLAIFAPVNFYTKLFTGSGGTLHNGQMDFGEGLGGAMIVLLFAAVFAIISYVLIRFAFARPASNRLPETHDDID